MNQYVEIPKFPFTSPLSSIVQVSLTISFWIRPETLTPGYIFQYSSSDVKII